MDITPRQCEVLEVLEHKDVTKESWEDVGNLYQLHLMMEDKILRSPDHAGRPPVWL